MLDLLNLIYVGTIVVGQLVRLINPVEIPLPQALGEVRQVAYIEHRMWPYTSKCNYTGVVVPYERTWPEVNALGITQPPEPGKIAGYGLILNKRECVDKPVELVNYAGVVAGQHDALPRDRLIPFIAFDEKTAPKWVPQAGVAIAQSAATNEAAKGFLEFAKQEAGKLKPGAEGVSKYEQPQS